MLLKHGKSIILMAIIVTIVPFIFNEEKVLDLRITGLYIAAGLHGLGIGLRHKHKADQD
ncbi:hypothetical protein [Pradoshia sp.]